MKAWFLRFWQFRASMALLLLLGSFLWAGEIELVLDLCDREWEISGTDAICLYFIYGGADLPIRVKSPETAGSETFALAFEPNLGQADDPYQFLARTRTMGVLLNSGNAVLALNRGVHQPPAYLEANLVGASPRAEAVPEEPLPGRSHYFFGNQPEQWITNVPSSSRVRYKNVYPGIDIVYYGTEGQLEHDFIVHPGADPRRIRMQFQGAGDVRLDADGNARIALDGHEILWRKPVLYQSYGNRRVPVEGRYKLEGAGLSFEFGRFDPDRPLVIDPVVEFSTFHGRTQSDGAARVAVDSQGNIYSTGITFEFSFPTSYRVGNFVRGNGTTFLTKVAANGSAPVFQAYLGGGRTDGAIGIALDAQNNIYLAGGTRSTDYPVTAGVLKSRFNPPGLPQADPMDCVVTKVAASGDALVYSTYLGGSRQDGCAGIAVDAQGNAVVTGYTESSADFPTSASAPQRSIAGRTDVFIAKLNATGTALVYSTLLGGQDSDLATGITLDSQGAAYVTGNTMSANNFPVTSGAYQTRFGGASRGIPTRFGDGFVAKLNPAGTAFPYITFLGGALEDIAMAVAVDSQGAAYVTGFTTSTNFPTTNGAYKSAYAGTGGNIYFPGGDAFAAKLNPAGSALVYSTYLGGARDDWGAAIAVDASGNAWVAGATLSPDFPTTSDATQRTFGGTDPTEVFPFGDAFITQLNGNGSALVFSSFVGGRGDEFALGLAIDPSGGVVLSGSTLSANFPVTSGAMQPSYGGWSSAVLPLGDAFLVKYAGSGTGTFVSAIVSAASYAGGGVAPGEIAVLTGGGIGPQQLTTLTLAQDGTVSTTLAGTRVLFDNTPAPILYALTGQTSVIVPYEVTGKQNVQLVVDYNGVRSLPLTVPVVQSKPALFSANASGRGQGAILNADFSYNSSANPVAKGGIVLLFGTGEGPIDPPGVTGRVNASVFPRIVLPVMVTIGGQNARVLYAGAAPGQVGGLFQMNVEVPQGAASGNQEVVVTIGNTRSQTGVTVAVQ